jgi:hypothetical protein
VNGLATAARATAKFFKDAGKQIWRFVSSIFGNGGREFEDTDLEIDPDAPPMTLYQDTPGTDAGTGWVVSFGLGEYPQLLAQLDNQASAITVPRIQGDDLQKRQLRGVIVITPNVLQRAPYPPSPGRSQLNSCQAP